MQTVRSSLSFIRNCKQTRVDENQILSMEIVKKGKREYLSYDTKDFPHESWVNHPDYLVLEQNLKFIDKETHSFSVEKISTGSSITNVINRVSSSIKTSLATIDSKETNPEEAKIGLKET